jgi:carboxypeptidase family protein
MNKTTRKVFAALLATMSLLLLMIAAVTRTRASAAPTASQDPPARVLLQGTVSDGDGNLLTNAQLIVHWDPVGANSGLTTNVGIPEDRFLKTDTHGAYYAEIPPGFYDVLITAPGFTPTCSKIRLKPAENQTLSAKLLADTAVKAELAGIRK